MLAIIEQIKEKIKHFWKRSIGFLSKDAIFFSLLIVLASSISFLLGSLSEFQKQKENKINKIELLEIKKEKKVYYVASKKGKRFYLPWCYSGSEKNRITFKTKTEAKKMGYTAAKNCEGL